MGIGRGKPPEGNESKKFFQVLRFEKGTNRIGADKTSWEGRTMFTHSELIKGNRGVVILVMALVIVASGRLPVQAQNTTVSGVVKNASGDPVVGALVRVRSADRGLTFMVVSQAQGRYSTPDLLPGKYTVEGFGGEYQSAPGGAVEVSSGQQGKMDVALTVARKVSPPEKRMTDEDYEKLMPEGEAKELITSRCLICHGLGEIVPRRAKRDEWVKMNGQMGYYLEEMGMPLSAQELATIIDYTSKNFGPETPRLSGGGRAADPNRHLPRALLQGAEAKYLVMEFNLKAGAEPHDITADTHGIAWVSERGAQSIGRFDPQTFNYTRIPVPPGKMTAEEIKATQTLAAGVNAIAADTKKDRVWLFDNGPNNRLLVYNTKSREFNTYNFPAPSNALRSSINTIRFLNGNVWGTGISTNIIYKFDPLSQKVTEYRAPAGSRPYGMAIGGDQAVWYAAMYGNEIVRVDPSTGKLTHYEVPTPKAVPRRMGADADGNLWAGAHEADKLVKVDYRTGKVTEYAIPTAGGGPYSVDADLKRNLVYFSEQYGDKIGRFDPRTNAWAEFPLPTLNADVRRIEVDPSNPNRIWWSGSASDKIGYVEVME